MALRIIYLICIALIGFSVGAFASFVISKLRKIDFQTDSIPKHHWSMGIYMNNIPQNEQNTNNLGSVLVKIYERGEYSDIPIPRKGEEIRGVYYNGEDRFEMTGIVNNVFYNTDIDWIVVSCKCVEIRKNLK